MYNTKGIQKLILYLRYFEGPSQYNIENNTTTATITAFTSTTTINGNYTTNNILTHCYQVTHKRVIGKQYRPRSDATSCGV